MVGAAWAAIGVAFLVLLGFLAESRAGRRSLDAKIDKLGTKLDTKIDKLGSDLRGEIGELRGDIGELRNDID
nr:hypothetical protein [Actinomycetota bacterium]